MGIRKGEGGYEREWNKKSLRWEDVNLTVGAAEGVSRSDDHHPLLNRSSSSSFTRKHVRLTLFKNFSHETSRWSSWQKEKEGEFSPDNLLLIINGLIKGIWHLKEFIIVHDDDDDDDDHDAFLSVPSQHSYPKDFLLFSFWNEKRRQLLFSRLTPRRKETKGDDASDEPFSDCQAWDLFCKQNNVTASWCCFQKNQLKSSN